MMRWWVPLLLIGCGKETGDSGLPPSACDGRGDLILEIGSGAIDGTFEPWQDLEVVDITDNGVDKGLALEIVATGLDNREQLNAVIRVAWDPPTAEDYLGGFFGGCADETGEITAGLRAPLPDAYQASPLDLAGRQVEMSVTITDVAGRTVEDQLTVELFLAL